MPIDLDTEDGDVASELSENADAELDEQDLEEIVNIDGELSVDDDTFDLDVENDDQESELSEGIESVLEDTDLEETVDDDDLSVGAGPIVDDSLPDIEDEESNNEEDTDTELLDEELDLDADLAAIEETSDSPFDIVEDDLDEDDLEELNEIVDIEEESLALEESLEEEFDADIVEDDLDDILPDVPESGELDELDQALEDFADDELEDVLEDLSGEHESPDELLAELDDDELNLASIEDEPEITESDALGSDADQGDVADRLDLDDLALSAHIDDISTEPLAAESDVQAVDSFDASLPDETQEKITNLDIVEDELSDLPGLDDWLDDEPSESSEDNETEVTSAVAEDDDILQELESVSFDELLENIDSDDNKDIDTQDQLGAAEAPNPFDAVPELNLDALLAEESGDIEESAEISSIPQSDNEEPEIGEDFLDIDNLIDESVDAESEPLIEQPIDLDLAIEEFSELVDDNDLIDVDNDQSESSSLDLARAYIEIDDNESAKEMLEKVVDTGTPEQQQEAAQILAKLTSSS